MSKNPPYCKIFFFLLSPSRGVISCLELDFLCSNIFLLSVYKLRLASSTSSSESSSLYVSKNLFDAYKQRKFNVMMIFFYGKRKRKLEWKIDWLIKVVSMVKTFTWITNTTIVNEIIIDITHWHSCNNPYKQPFSFITEVSIAGTFIFWSFNSIGIIFW